MAGLKLVSDGLEELLLFLHERFAKLAASQVDEQLADGLQLLAELLGVDYAALACSDKSGRLQLSHRYSASHLRAIPALDLNESFPWASTALAKGQVIALRQASDLPAEAIKERIWAAGNQVRGCLAIPLGVRGIRHCAFVLATSREQVWPADLIIKLQFAGSIFAQALARKHLEEDLQATRESLAHMLRVAMTGQLATSIAHELNQPLSAMLANAQAAMRFISRPNPDFGETTEALTEIVRDGKRAGEVITCAHTMLKRNNIEYSSQDINSLITAVRPLVDNYATHRRVHVYFGLADNLPAVRGHGVQLQQVALNLLINAIDAIAPELEEKGVVSLTTACGPKPGEVLIRVRDNGVGLPPGPVEQIFRPFFTSKTSGLGMGLSICRTIVEAHGGQLSAERNADAGTTFQFMIPSY